MSRPEYVWKFDINRRVYNPGFGGGPIWREHWAKHKIVGENRVSYLLEHGGKVSKKPSGVHVFDEAHLNELVWANANRHKIARIVLSEGYNAITTAQLREVARVIGYTEEPK